MIQVRVAIVAGNAGLSAGWNREAGGRGGVAGRGE